MLVAASPVGCTAAGLFSPPENQPVPSPTHLIVRAQGTLMTCFALIPELATAEMRKNAFPATSPWDSLQTAQTHPQLSLHLAPSRCHVLPGCRTECPDPSSRPSLPPDPMLALLHTRPERAWKNGNQITSFPSSMAVNGATSHLR